LPEAIRICIEDPSQVAEARRTARQFAVRLNFDNTAVERIAIVVTEAATNLIKHAGRGEILLIGSDTSSDLAAVALDRGPGMSDLERCIRDGYSTGGSLGHGLGAIIRLSTATDFHSLPGKGTAVFACWTNSGHRDPQVARSRRIRVGAVNVSKPGQEVCGDSWGIEYTQGEAVILVADGLGHGYDAKVASKEAVRILREYPALSPKMLLENVHQALRSTRGAAVAVARINTNRGVIDFAGVGNISAQIYSGRGSAQHLVSCNGTAGLQIPRLQEFSYTWPEQGVLVMHSDGLSTNTGFDNYPRLASQEPTLAAGVLYRDFSRGNDDSTVVVVQAAA
jgi:anti-sigma regulatory factor (Ser/Thr protein kinase)